jgi:hypothetical protein
VHVMQDLRGSDPSVMLRHRRRSDRQRRSHRLGPLALQTTEQKARTRRFARTRGRHLNHSWPRHEA